MGVRRCLLRPQLFSDSWWRVRKDEEAKPHFLKGDGVLFFRKVNEKLYPKRIEIKRPMPENFAAVGFIENEVLTPGSPTKEKRKYFITIAPILLTLLLSRDESSFHRGQQKNWACRHGGFSDSEWTWNWCNCWRAGTPHSRPHRWQLAAGRAYIMAQQSPNQSMKRTRLTSDPLFACEYFQVLWGFV